MKYGDKIGTCEVCERENAPLQYSWWVFGWICEWCWEFIGEYISTAKDVEY